ncbi:hypothetical protein ABZ297_10610 [Nonomuraea sp. NPDC005983]|uniref:hypothetical protein n=1 Tax=Nonomuraea sp. NPDC005983 TaxID=3155595 RepID=UPI0033ABA601
MARHNLGVRGAALATVLARAVTLAISLATMGRVRDAGPSFPATAILRTGLPMSAAVSFLRWMTLYLVPFGGLIAVGGALQASGRGGRLLAATLAGFAVQLPLAYLLSSWLGIEGVWLSMAAGASISLAGALGRSGSALRSAPDPAPRSTRTAAGRQCGR